MNSFEEEYDEPYIDTIATLAEHMVYRLPGCTDLMIRKTLQQSFADFCRLSCCLKTTQFIKLDEKIFQYQAFPKTPKMRIDTISNVYINHRKLEEYEYTVRGSVILLNRNICFRDDDILKIEAIEIPPYGSEEAPQWFIDKYGQAIVSGALVKLFGMSNKPWTDGAQAQVELITWENFLTSARINSVQNNTNNGHLNVLDTSDLL